jgi:hypothetical protein
MTLLSSLFKKSEQDKYFVQIHYTGKMQPADYFLTKLDT